MINRQTKKREREKLASRRHDDDVAQSGNARWVQILLVVAAAVVLVLGYAFVRRVFIAPPVDAAVERQDDMVRAGQKIQVNVLNSASTKGLARRAMDYLRARGFDVVEIGNASAAQPHSAVIDRVNDSLSARKVAFALGIPDSCIRREENRELFLDVTVVIGDDYELLKPWR